MKVYLILRQRHIHYGVVLELAGITLSGKKANAHAEKLNKQVAELWSYQKDRYYVSVFGIGFHDITQIEELIRVEE